MSNDAEHWIARLKDEQPLSHNDRLQIAAELFAATASLDMAHQQLKGNDPDAPTPPELLASRLIDVWCEEKKRQIPWAKAIEIMAILTKMPEPERQRLLALDDTK